MGRTFGYSRPTVGSPDPQDHDRELAQAGASEIYVERHAAGTGRPMLARQRLLRTIAAGDTLILAQLDRLGSNLDDVLSCLDLLIERGVHLRVLNPAFETRSADIEAQRALLRLLAATRSAFRSSLVKAKRAAAREKGGKPGGPPPTLTEDQWPTIRRRLDSELIGAVATDLGVSRQTLWTYRRRMAEQEQIEAKPAEPPRKPAARRG